MAFEKWTEIKRWSRQVAGINLSVGQDVDGNWRWSANRYPDIHAKGSAASKDDAMRLAMDVTLEA